MSDIKIHKAVLSAELKEELITMSSMWESENSCYGYRANTAEEFKKQDIFTACLDGLTVGYLLCHTYTQEKENCTVPMGTRCLEIEELYILPEHRRRGIGKALFKAAVESYGDIADYVTLSTATKDYKSILHFYIDEVDMTFWSARLFQKLR